jgi:hypothetical protein
MASMRRGSAQFVVCAAVLAAGAAALTCAKFTGALRLMKKPVPLRRPIDQLALPSPYRARLLPRLDSEAEQELGTADYAVWNVVDTRLQDRDPGRFMQLFITYYTGKPDQVPHVPEECYVQGGRRTDEDRTVTLTLGENRKIPVRRLLFRDPRGPSAVLVYYTFSVNGDFYAGREGVRSRMADFRESHLYYSKVEISFPTPDADRMPRDALEEAAAALFGVVVPALASDHWTDVGALESSGRTS